MSDKSDNSRVQPEIKYCMHLRNIPADKSTWENPDEIPQSYFICDLLKGTDSKCVAVNHLDVQRAHSKKIAAAIPEGFNLDIARIMCVAYTVGPEPIPNFGEAEILSAYSDNVIARATKGYFDKINGKSKQ